MASCHCRWQTTTPLGVHAYLQFYHIPLPFDNKLTVPIPLGAVNSAFSSPLLSEQEKGTKSAIGADCETGSMAHSIRIRRYLTSTPS